MLAEGLEKCPVCGARLPPAIQKTGGGKRPEEESSTGQPLNRSETLSITAYLVSVMLIPLIVIIVIGLICAVIANLGN
jgi:hypothetical protein